jgi:hypothetical protein
MMILVLMVVVIISRPGGGEIFKVMMNWDERDNRHIQSVDRCTS